MHIYIGIAAKCYPYAWSEFTSEPWSKIQARTHKSKKQMFDLQATAIVNLRALQFTSEDCKFEDYSRALVNLQARVLWAISWFR